MLNDTLQHTTELGIANSSARILPANTVCLSRTASVGYVVVMGRPMATSQDFVNWVCSEALDPNFLKYVLLAERSAFLRFASGTTHQTIYFPEVKAFHVCLPPIKEQRAIADILGTLDDKIELNRRMSETLEAMARALFKSWFVDFEPVRAKAEGRETGLPTGLADLFPDCFDESELGEVPKGWRVGALGTFFEVGLGGAWGSDERSARETSAVRCLRGIDCHELAEGRVPDVPMRWITPKQAADRNLSEGTILVEGSGSFCGRSLSWRDGFSDLLGGPVGYSNFCKRLVPLCTSAQAVVCWMQMRRAYRDGLLQSFRTGTAFPNLDMHGLLENFAVLVPPVPVADRFREILFSSQRLDFMAQSRTLAAIRDTLLPELVSGALRIAEGNGSAIKEPTCH